jgi:hypothetical protein
MIFWSKSTFADYSSKILHTELPRIEIAGDIGFVWLLQASGTVNLNNSSYLKYRMSTIYGISEMSLLAGYQYLLGDENRVQIGLGYANATIQPMGNIGSLSPTYKNNSNNKVNYPSATIEINYIQFFNDDFLKIGFNAGVNLIIRTAVIPSVNIGLNMGVF